MNLSLDDEFYVEDELKLGDLSNDELVEIARDEVPSSEHLEELQRLQRADDEIQQQQDAAERQGDSIPEVLKIRSAELDEQIEAQRLRLIDDIETFRDNVGGPRDPEESDIEGNEDGPFGSY